MRAFDLFKFLPDLGGELPGQSHLAASTAQEQRLPLSSTGSAEDRGHKFPLPLLYVNDHVADTWGQLMNIIRTPFSGVTEWWQLEATLHSLENART